MTLMIYASNGYVGQLLARAAHAAGLAPLLAGRQRAGVEGLARELGLPARVFGLDDPELAAQLRGVSVVINCAGPFTTTLPRLLDACMIAGVHYLDLAGEYTEHQLALERDAALVDAGIMAMPGVGFGVVPTDAVAALALARLPDAEALDIVYDTRGGASRGTLATVLPMIHRAGVQRRAGALVSARPGAERRSCDLGAGPVRVVSNPWRADLISAWASTGVPTISTFSSFPALARVLMKLGRLLDTRIGAAAIRTSIRLAPAGPSSAERAQGSTWCMAEARRGEARVRVRLRGPEAYAFTVACAVEVARRVLEGELRPGYQTPSRVFGPGLVLDLPGVELIEDEGDARGQGVRESEAA